MFNRGFSGLVVYVDKIKPPDTRLAGILISDERNPREQSTIVAAQGSGRSRREERDHHASA